MEQQTVEKFNTRLCAGCRKKQCDGCMLRESFRAPEDKSGLVFPKTFQADEQQIGYGVAIDIGTTTVAGFLWNLEKGILMASWQELNPQAHVGADVISRIQYALQSKEKAMQLQSMITDCLEQVICQLKIKAGVPEAVIAKIVIVGNTTMCHLLLGYSVQGIAKAPFQAAYTGELELNSAQLGLKEDNIKVQILPGIGGHVGSDITAGCLVVQKFLQRGNYLLLDIGTNGEMVLQGNGRTYACSTAAGPAFEGAGVTCGMRATKGAIEQVAVEDGQIKIQVIGQGRPEGICGSGLIDTLAVLLETGVVDENGYLLSQEEAKAKGLPGMIYRRLVCTDEENGFVLYQDIRRQIIITNRDIRSLQLAKGAIRAGIAILLKKADMTEQELHAVFLAGAFGNYIRTESALRIGLLPEISEEQIIGIGNAAGSGAGMALLSKASSIQAAELVSHIQHVELASEPDFEEIYLRELNFVATT